MTTSEFTVRRATEADRAAIVDLCRSSLGWKPNDPNERFFAWKHDLNPFGPSPAWVAEAEGRLLGVRVFLRWRFRGPDGTLLRGVRAVDTATHPDAQGRGIFTRLTLDALPDLRDDGVEFIFNTPNDKSRPGYLKMGWAAVGRVPVAVRVAGVRRLPAVSGARAAADKWSQPSAVGLSAPDAFADGAAVAAMLSMSSPQARISTDRDIAYLRWRYAFDALHYRVVPVDDSIAAGAVVFRLRRRGAALEATISELAVPSPSAARATLGSILRATGADYAIAAGGPELLQAGFVPAPPLGPMLTWKPVARTGVPAMSELRLGLGDVELFDLSSPGRGDDSSRATYRAAPQLIWRTVLQGVVVLRWDHGGEIVMLNPSAWMVMDALVSGASPMTLDAIIRAIEAHATFDVSAVDDLRRVLDELVGRELVIGLD